MFKLYSLNLKNLRVFASYVTSNCNSGMQVNENLQMTIPEELQQKTNDVEKKALQITTDSMHSKTSQAIILLLLLALKLYIYISTSEILNNFQ